MPRRMIQIICFLAKFWLELNIVNGPEVYCLPVTSNWTIRSSRSIHMRKRVLFFKKQKGLVVGVSKCLTWDTERWDVLSTYELYAWFQIFYWLDASDLGGQGCHGKVSWWFHPRDDTYLWLFWWVSAVTGISLKTRVKISFQCRNCCTLVDLRTTYICPSGVSWISLVWICLVVLFDQTFILFSN
jgi:hypothetical protein